MDFEKNNAGLDSLMSRFGAFTNGNPLARFSPFHMPIEQFQRAPELTREAMGDAASETVSGVLSGDEGDGAVALFTGNSPGASERASFLVDILSNWDTFFAWMKSYIDIRQNGFSIVYRRATEEGRADDWLAIGPGFQSLNESPYAVADTAQRALARLLEKMENQILIEPDWDDEKRQFAYDIEWTYEGWKNHNDIGRDMMRIVGRWTKPDSRLAVRTHMMVPVTVAEGSADMIATKRAILEDLWSNRERAGGKRPS